MPRTLRTQDGRDNGEVSTYRAVMMSVANEAMKGKISAQRLFLQQVNEAAAVHGDMTKWARFVVEENIELRKDIAKLREIFPEFTGTGVVYETEDGTLIPTRWYDAIKSGNLKMPRLHDDEDGEPEDTP